MLYWFKVYLATIPLFFLIDMLWLGVVAKNFYREGLGELLRPDVNWIAAIIFYLLFIGGILYFAVVPGLERGEWTVALFRGAFLGLLAYATYDLTNLAILRAWPLHVSILDMVWGTLLSGTVAFLAYHIAVMFRPTI